MALLSGTDHYGGAGELQGKGTIRGYRDNIRARAIKTRSGRAKADPRNLLQERDARDKRAAVAYPCRFDGYGKACSSGTSKYQTE
jgi:hypothetical protein